jgi:two-component system, OmpR family, response regulator
MSRVLVVEDDDRIAHLVSRALQNDGFAVQRAATGPTGMAAAIDGEFDLIVLDLMLPGLDGTDVLKHVVESRPTLPVLVLSAMPEIGVRVACLEAGAADFLGKPFAVAELLARVRTRMRGAPTANTSFISAGPVRLDLRLRRATVAGRRIELSEREFLLLQHLMRRRGDVCSRAELLADVWGLTFDPGSNVVDVCVRRLRAKLDTHDRVETVRHVGYRFNPD